ncbi:MAG: hypothetical protein Q9217_001986 [Psora testacea]
MILAGTQRADSALGLEPSFSQGPFLPFGCGAVKTSPTFYSRFLDKNPLLERSQCTHPHCVQGLPPQNSSQETVRPDETKQKHEVGSSKRRPRHVPIIITQDVINSALNYQPRSPITPESSSGSSSAFTFNLEKEEGIRPARRPQRARHIPIEIPAFAQPLGLFPLTPSISANTTPRASFRSNHSCEQIIIEMSRHTTSGSRRSTLDSNVSAPSPSQIFDDRFKPASSSYLADMNSSSESSLNQAIQDVQNNADVTYGPKPGEAASVSATCSPALGSQAPATSSGTTNLSGLVCNVHKCTGKEPHGLVGATTTILGDKMYVFGGRILSRRRPYLSSDIYQLDLIRRHWTKVQTTGDIPAPRYFHSVCPLGDTKLICYGGMSTAPSQAQTGNSQDAADPNGEMAVMSDIHVYDAATHTWTYIATSDTPPGRYAHCAAVLPSSAIFTSANAPLSAILHNPPGEKPNQGTLGVALDGTGGAEMIVVGGQDSNNKYIDAISVFNLRSLNWTDTHSLPRSCGAYRSVVTPLVGLPPSKIGAGPDQEDFSDGANGTTDRSDSTSSMLIYSNYNFLDVKLELQVRLPNGSLVEKTMNGQVSPPGLRFPNGDVLDNHFIVSGTYLTSSKHEYALWALDLRTLTWSRIDAGSGIFSQGSWNRGILWARRNTFIILGNRKRSLVDDYNHRRINFSNICMVELEAFGLYDNPRRQWPTSNYQSISSPILPPSVTCKTPTSGGGPLSSAAVDLGTMAMNIRDLADMELLAIGGERIPVNSSILSRRWGPYFIRLLRETNTSSSTHNDTSSSSDGGTLRPNHLNPSSSLASRNSSITITPSITTSHSVAPSSVTAMSNASNSTTTASTTLDPPTPHSLPASSRPRQLYMPHTFLTLRALVHYFYTSSLPAPNHHLCTPQILCSLLQIARPYRIDGLLETTVERLHQILDGRNAAAVFNAAAMAAGGGRGTGTTFGMEGDTDLAEDLQTSPAMARLQARNTEMHDETSESETDTGSEISSATSTSALSEGSNRADGEKVAATVGEREIWAGGVSCVVGLQKRGLRGLMEGRRIREKERGRAVGGLGSSNVNGTGPAGGGSGGGGLGNGNGTTVGLGIA